MYFKIIISLFVLLGGAYISQSEAAATKQVSGTIASIQECLEKKHDQLVKECPVPTKVFQAWISALEDLNVDIPCTVKTFLNVTTVKSCKAATADEKSKSPQDIIQTVLLVKSRKLCAAKNALTKLNLLEKNVFSNTKVVNFIQNSVSKNIAVETVTHYNDCLKNFKADDKASATCKPFMSGFYCTAAALTQEFAHCAVKKCNIQG